MKTLRSMAQSMVQTTLFPAWLTFVAIAALFAYEHGAHAGAIITAAAVATALLTTIFERLLPYQEAWNRTRGDLATDMTSFGVLAALVDPALKAAGAALVLWIAGLIQPYSLGLFPKAQPLMVQIALVFLIAEFGKYWAHRWQHERPLLWEFHAMHHSVERLYTLNNFRLHPVNHALSYLFGIFPLAVLGAPAEPLVVYSAVAIAVSFFQHANIDLRFGFLNYVLSTNELHRWHHSVELAEGNRNYGSVLIVWDLLFNTHYLRRQQRHPEKIGLTNAAYPTRGYVRQLFWPYCSRFCAAA